MYDEIVRGYENGTREIYVEDEFGIHRLTKEEDLFEYISRTQHSAF